MRSDYVKAFKGPSGTHTPNLDAPDRPVARASTAWSRSACPRCRSGARSSTGCARSPSGPGADRRRCRTSPAGTGLGLQPALTEPPGCAASARPTSPTTRSSAGRASPRRSGRGRHADQCCAVPRQAACDGRRDRRHQAPSAAVGAPSAPASASCASWSERPLFLAHRPFDPVDAAEAPPIYIKPGRVDSRASGR